MKPAVYLTKPEEMRKARLNQPRVTSEQARAQRECLRRASEKFSADPGRLGFSEAHDANANGPSLPCETGKNQIIN